MSRAPSNGGVGVVHLVGAGPGAPDLLTLRAARLLAEADIVFHDALVHPEVLALAVRARKIAVGKRCGRLSTAQRFINRQLIDAALHHRTVVRLKGGDPMLFGRAQEEIDALEAAGVRVEVVPGISAAFGAAADLSRSLTLRGASRSVTFITPAVGWARRSDWARPAAAADTVALYMASRRAAEIAQGLIAQGVPADRPVVLVENATLPNRRVHATRLSGLAQAAAGLGDGPALLLVGEVYRALLEAPADADLEGASQRHSDVDSLLSLPSRLPVRAAA
jgi:uroporphyrin-III C-methyltransferase